MRNVVLDPPSAGGAAAEPGSEVAAEPAPAPAPAGPSATQAPGLVLARLVSLDGAVATVEAQGHPAGAALSARIACALGADDCGADVVLAFENADAMRPLIIGRLTKFEGAGDAPRRLDFEAEEELTLRCGKASLTLTRSGKVLLRGAYVSTRSTGVHRIKGASVEIN